MSYTFDTVQRALSLVRDAPNLTDRQKDLISFSQDVIDQWHTVNHSLQDALSEAPPSKLGGIGDGAHPAPQARRFIPAASCGVFSQGFYKDARSTEATAYLHIIIQEPDKIKQSERMKQYIEGTTKD